MRVFNNVVFVLRTGQLTNFFLYFFLKGHALKNQHHRCQFQKKKKKKNSIYRMGCFFFFIHVILQFRNKSWSVSFTPSLIRIHFVKLQRWPWFVWKVSDWLETYFKAGISGDLIGLSCFTDGSLWGSGTALNIFRGTLRELIFARTNFREDGNS